MQSANDYLETLSSTSGLPHVMVQRNMDKINYALTHLELILNGLTRGIDLSVLDKGYGEHGGSPVCFFPTTHALGLVMPSNSPAVNSLWLPSIALKIPIIMKRIKNLGLISIDPSFHCRRLSERSFWFLSYGS